MKQMVMLAFIFILINLNAKAQTKKNKLFINKDTSEFIFIDTPRSSFHDLVFKYLLPDFMQTMPIKLDKKSNYSFESDYKGDWISVKKFKGKYFAYYPSEPYYNTFFRLSDTLLSINDFNEGFISCHIVSTREVKKKLTIAFYGSNNSRHVMSVKQKTKNIYIVRCTLFNTRKLFFVKRKDYYNYPIIVNNCPTSRCKEFNFK